MSSYRLDARQRVIYLLLTALTVLIVACQSPPIETEQWTLPYLQLQLRAGKVQVQWSGDSEWTTVEGGASITVEEKGQIVADVEGASFHLGDGSMLELGPKAIMGVQNSPSFPRLQMVLQDGSFLLVAQKPSYELIIPTCSVTLLCVPSQIRVKVSDDTTHLAVEEGAVVCALETETLTLPKCREMYIRAGEEPETSEFCDAGATATAYAMTPSPTFSFWGPETTPTPTATPSPTATPTRAVVIPTSTPLLATDTPLPPPPPTSAPPPPPTSTPPPPTSTPPPPTHTSPPPTATLRPTPTSEPPTPTDTPRPPPPTDTPSPTDTPASPPTKP